MAGNSPKEPLGIGLRLVLAYYVATFAFGVFYAAIKNAYDFKYDLSLIWALLQMVVCTQVIWLIIRRAHAARYAVIIGTTASCTLAAFDLFGRGAFADVARAIGFAAAQSCAAAFFVLGIACIIYMKFSRHARRVLFVKHDSLPYALTGHSWDVPLRERVRTMVFWRDITMYFIVFSFLGHWAEMLFCWNIHLGVFMGHNDFGFAMLWSTWLYPYSAEGLAIVIVVAVLHPVKEWLRRVFKGRILPTFILSFASIVAMCVLVELTLGLLINRDYSIWDYRDIPFNFMGQICLQNTSVIAITGVITIWVIYPLMDRLIRRMPKSYADGLFFSLVGIYVFCGALHFMYLGPNGLVVGVTSF